MTTKLPISDEEKNLWAQVMRGLHGIIRICEHYAKDGYTTLCPTNDLQLCASKLSLLAQWCDQNNLADPEQPSYESRKA